MRPLLRNFCWNRRSYVHGANASRLLPNLRIFARSVKGLTPVSRFSTMVAEPVQQSKWVGRWLGTCAGMCFGAVVLGKIIFIFEFIVDNHHIIYYPHKGGLQG